MYNNFMEKLDGRKLDHKTLEEIRIRAVLRVEAGESTEAVIEALGFHRACIYDWIAKYREGGLEALKAKPLDGRPPKLKGRQIDKLYKIITTKNPLQLNFSFALWTREMVRELIREKFAVKLSDVSVGRLLRKMGLSPQKPLRRAYQRDEEKVNTWKEVAFPEIKKLAKKQNAAIYFGDESSIRSDYHCGTTWAPIGETPVIETTGARYSINLISAVTASGGMRFMTINGKMNADKFIAFLQRLIYNATKNIFLILDGHPVHKSKKVRAFVESTRGGLRLFILPPYSPNLNPDEWVWGWLKRNKIGRSVITGPDQFKAVVKKYMKSLQNSPALISGFFRDKNLSYIFA